jgi:structural maintenance of chromosomes protein 6
MMPKAFNEITRRGKEFRDPPIGPLGMHVKLKNAKDEEWVTILERLFGRNLNAFLVTNHDDRKRLATILEQNQW